MASYIRLARSALLLAAVAALGPSAVVPVDARLGYYGDYCEKHTATVGSTSRTFATRTAAQAWMLHEERRQERAHPEGLLAVVVLVMSLLGCMWCCGCQKTLEPAPASAPVFGAGAAPDMGQSNYGAVAAPQPVQAPQPSAGGAQFIVPTVVQQDGAVSSENLHVIQEVPAGTGPAGVQMMP